MNRNEEAKYAEMDTIETPRSVWDRKIIHKTSFNMGYLIPFFVDMDIIPGTTIKNKTSIVCRMTTPLYPIMDNLYLDTYYFKASKFWYWEHWRAMMGENDMGAWAQTIEYTEPKIITTSARPTTKNDLSTYMGIRMGTANLKYSKMPVNAYIDIWNNWFRDQNLQAPIQFDKTDANLNVDGTINTGCGLLPVQKFHDYFTSALPQPQKGTPVTTPLGISAPVVGNGMTLGLQEYNTNKYLNAKTIAGYNIATTNPSVEANTDIQMTTDRTKSGMIVDLTKATAATINALRLAFATQRILEKDARLGTRYREILRGHFGVTASDEAMLVPEYLGGQRTPINIETVLQNSSTDDTSPLGQTGAFSVTQMLNEDFTKSFTKDDMLIGLLCVRGDHTYQQCLPRQYTRTRRLDRYWPSLAHIGNQPIYNYEIFAQGTAIDDGVFGYKEAFQEYIYKNNMISGEMLSDYAQSLDAWHLGDDYATLPVLSDQWIREPQKYLDRCVAVESTVSHQFWADIMVNQTVTAPIPMNRTPGLVDHF